MISREQLASELYALFQRFDDGIGNTWEDRVALVARDPDLPSQLRPLLMLDDKGHGVLLRLLQEAQDRGDPIGLVVLDSLSRLKPAEVDENDNNAMTRWLDALEQIASDYSVYILIIHHMGHARDGRSAEPKGAGRGASAIGAVTAVQMVLKKGRQPRQRVLRVEGNSVLGGEMTFQVSDAKAHENSIDYFKLAGSYSTYDPVELVGSEAISTNELAGRLSSKRPGPGKNPPGTSGRLAAKLRDHWLARNLIEVFDGPRGAKMLRLKSDLATSPPPRQDSKARSGKPHLATAPIEALSGEVEEVPGVGATHRPEERTAEARLPLEGKRALTSQIEEVVNRVQSSLAGQREDHNGAPACEDPPPTRPDDQEPNPLNVPRSESDEPL